METANRIARTKSVDETVAETNERNEFYARASTMDLTPLWALNHYLVKDEPSPQAIAHRCRFSEDRPFLM
ncbi:hypothetical protein D3C84_1222160 [compost metagenome]